MGSLCSKPDAEKTPQPVPAAAPDGRGAGPAGVQGTAAVPAIIVPGGAGVTWTGTGGGNSLLRQPDGHWMLIPSNPPQPPTSVQTPPVAREAVPIIDSGLKQTLVPGGAVTITEQPVEPPRPPTPPPPHEYSLAFKQLPGELNEEILAYLPDILSFKRAARSCRSLYHAACSAKDRIATSVIHNEIAPELLPEAFLALAASRMSSSTEIATLRDFLSTHMQSRSEMVPAVIPLEDASKLGRLHTAVEHFAARYRDMALARLTREAVSYSPSPSTPLSGPGTPVDDTTTLPPRPPSPTNIGRAPTPAEQVRFARAFYRVEMYSNLFRKHARANDPQLQRELFVQRLAPWELEQTICAVHFLARAVLAPRLLYTCKRYFKWAKRFEGYAGRRVSPLLLFQYQSVSRGLVFLHKLDLQPKTEFRKLVRLPELGATLNISLFFLLTHSYCLARYAPQWVSPPQSYLPAFYPEDDPGPRQAWTMTGQDHSLWGRSTTDFIADASMMQYRIAYVMWDWERLSLDGGDPPGRMFLPYPAAPGEDDFGLQAYDEDLAGHLRPWVVVPAGEAGDDPEEGRIFAEGFHDDYEGPIFVDPGSRRAGYPGEELHS